MHKLPTHMVLALMNKYSCMELKSHRVLCAAQELRMRPGPLLWRLGRPRDWPLLTSLC